MQIQEDVQYLLKAANNMFPTFYLSSADICSSWAGLRPLIYEKGKSPSEISRKDEIFVAKNGLISIAGGKLTAYRKMAQKVVDQIVRKEKRYGKCKTDAVLLCGNQEKGADAYESMRIRLKKYESKMQ